MSQHRSLSEIAAHLREVIASADFSGPMRLKEDDGFSALALELFAAQYEANPVYRSLCAARGTTPETLRHWSGIPAVSTAGFKEFELTCLPCSERVAVFHSSGTSGHKPSRHFHSRESLELYGVSLWAWFRRHLIPNYTIEAAPELAVLTPGPAVAPHSSLAHMFEMVRQRLGAPDSVFLGSACDRGWSLNPEVVLSRINCLARPSGPTPPRPLLLLGTAISFLELTEFMASRKESCPLPPGSRVMETGGYKGRSRTVTRERLHLLISRHFGIPKPFVISEYGMSELSSQGYALSSGPVRVAARTGGKGPLSSAKPSSLLGTASSPNGLSFAQGRQPVLHTGGSSAFQFPPWARARIVSPETGKEVTDGETGLIQVFDLANVFSVMAIQTEDLGVKRGGGFEFLGRAGEAEPRGCSLRVTP